MAWGAPNATRHFGSGLEAAYGWAKLQEDEEVLLTQLCSPLPHVCLILQPPQHGHCVIEVLTLIIWERSPASASSRTMLSSLSSMKESKYLMMLGWFSCCRGRECRRNIRIWSWPQHLHLLWPTNTHWGCTHSLSSSAADKTLWESAFPTGTAAWRCP